MATTVVTVNAGGGADYASLSAALAAQAGNLTGVTCDVADEQGNNTIAVDIVCSGSTADTTAVSFSGWTTDATHRLRIRGATITGPKWDTSLYRLVASPGAYVGTIQIGVAINLTLQDLQVESGSTLNNGARALCMLDFAWDVNVVRGFYRQTSTTGTYDEAGAIVYNAGSAAFTYRMRNVTAIGADSGGLVRLNYANNASALGIVYNCTFANRSANSRSIFLVTGDSPTTFRFKNLLIQGTGTCYTFGDGSADEALTILTQDATSPTGALQSKTIGFVDASNWDYHLDVTDTDAIGAGTDLSGDTYYPFSTDGDGQTRSSWDVGADEYVNAATLDQSAFRFYNDDGNEAGATPAAAENTDLTAPAGETRRIRMQVDATGDPATAQYQLEWRIAAGTWAKVVPSVSV